MTQTSSGGPRVEMIVVAKDEAGMRLDRWFKEHFPGLGFGHLQKLIRSGQVRVDGGVEVLDATLPPRGHIVVSAAEPALPRTPLHFLCDAHLGATARLLRMAGFDTTYDNNYADATIEALAAWDGVA